MNRATRIRATFLASALALSVAVVPFPGAEAAGKLNVNAASAQELSRVPGIDPQAAVRIVARRTSRPFRTLDELLEIPGITKLTLLGAVDHLEVGPPPPPATPVGQGRKLDLNRASFAQLLLLPEMTPRAAKSIVDWRDRNGPYRSVNDLGRVPGLEKRLLIGLIDRVTVDGPTPSTVAAAKPQSTPDKTIVLTDEGWSDGLTARIEERAARPTPTATSTPVPMRPGEKIDINSADRDTLQRLTGIGPVMAQRIVQHRQTHGPFGNVDELMRINGIGVKRMTALRPWVVASDSPGTRSVSTDRPSGATLSSETAALPARTALAISADGRVNINVAGIDDLLTLPRMTRAAASEIVKFRESNGPFPDPHDIVKVPTVGEATYYKIREKITVDSP